MLFIALIFVPFVLGFWFAPFPLKIVLVGLFALLVWHNGPSYDAVTATQLEWRNVRFENGRLHADVKNLSADFAVDSIKVRVRAEECTSRGCDARSDAELVLNLRLHQQKIMPAHVVRGYTEISIHASPMQGGVVHYRFDPLRDVVEIEAFPAHRS